MWCLHTVVLTQPSLGKNPVLLSDRSDFHIIDNLLSAVHAFARRIMLYSHNTTISGNIIKHNIRTSMNERTHFFIKNMYLSHFILDVSVVCERWVETGTDCSIYPTSSPDHSSTFSASWLWLLNRGSLKATALSLHAGPHSGLPVIN